MSKPVKDMTLEEIEAEITLIHLKENKNSDLNNKRHHRGLPLDEGLLRANDVLFKRLQELVIQRDKLKGVTLTIRG